MFDKSECDRNVVLKVKEIGGGYKYKVMFEELNIPGIDSNGMEVAIIYSIKCVFSQYHCEEKSPFNEFDNDIDLGDVGEKM